MEQSEFEKELFALVKEHAERDGLIAFIVLSNNKEIASTTVVSSEVKKISEDLVNLLTCARATVTNESSLPPAVYYRFLASVHEIRTYLEAEFLAESVLNAVEKKKGVH